MIMMLLISFLACDSPSKQQSAGEYVDDSVITTKVKSLLGADDLLKSFEISVETNKGNVQLSGSVDSQKTVDKAGEIAKGVKGGGGPQKLDNVISSESDLTGGSEMSQKRKQHSSSLRPRSPWPHYKPGNHRSTFQPLRRSPHDEFPLGSGSCWMGLPSFSTRIKRREADRGPGR